MADLSQLRFSRDHEWMRPEGGRLVVGITDYAQDAIGDVVFVDIPAPGIQVKTGETVVEVESTKTVASVLAPVDGELVEVHDHLGGNPDLLNSDPYGEGWLFVLQPEEGVQLEGFMDLADYQAFLKEITD